MAVQARYGAGSVVALTVVAAGAVVVGGECGD
jgi:hypothetical protein